MQKIMRHATMGIILCPAVASRYGQQGVSPGKRSTKPRAGVLANHSETSTEEVERDDTTFCKRSARPHPSVSGFRNCRAGAGAVGVGARFRCLLGYHRPKDACAVESPARQR